MQRRHYDVQVEILTFSNKEWPAGIRRAQAGAGAGWPATQFSILTHLHTQNNNYCAKSLASARFEPEVLPIAPCFVPILNIKDWLRTVPSVSIKCISWWMANEWGVAFFWPYWHLTCNAHRKMRLFAMGLPKVSLTSKRTTKYCTYRKSPGTRCERLFYDLYWGG